MLPPPPQVRVFLVRLCGTSEEKKRYQQAVQACAHLCSAAASPLVACVACRSGNHPAQRRRKLLPASLSPSATMKQQLLLLPAGGVWPVEPAGAGRSGGGEPTEVDCHCLG
jgi:hypothetical protein